MSLSKVFQRAAAKPPSAPDGLPDGGASSKSSGFLSDAMQQARQGLLGRDAMTMLQAVRTVTSEEPMNDRELMFEHGVALLQGLPKGSHMGQTIANDLIGMLWRDLPHPPASWTGNQNIYRTADGSVNNPLLPDLGKAGTPYSRSVPAVRPKPPNLPDPSLVFDLLLKRDKFKPHPSGLSSLFFAFATIVIHNCFSTSLKEPWINGTSSYVDLAPLYGDNQSEQDRVRTRNGYGTLLPDVFASIRLLLMPPAVCVLLILFNRNHNYIANRILKINEKGWYATTDEAIAALTPEQRAKQDEDVFQLSRNVTIALFAKIVLGDYVAAILNTPRANSEWSLDLGGEIRQKDGSRVERGGGNAVSIEFNLLYRWHAPMSRKDADWIEQVLQQRFGPDQDLSELTPEVFGSKIGALGGRLEQMSPSEWPIHGLTRGPDGRFPDDQLADMIKDATDEPAAQFGAHGIPSCLKVVDVMGMKTARNVWGVCTMNEFRKYLHLTPFKSFEEWNPDPTVWRAAEQLYGHIDDLELYPGLLAELSKPTILGSGVQPGHTIGRGILDDAVSLVRSDRFLTHDFNTSTLTSWGMSFLSKPCPGSMGGFLGNVLFNALPNAFGYNSTYVLMPFYTPAAAREIHTRNKDIQRYSTERTSSDLRLFGAQSHRLCREIFQDRDTFRTIYLDGLRKLFHGHGFFLGFDDKARHDPPHQMMTKAFHWQSFDEDVTKFFAGRTEYAIKQSSIAYSNSPKRQLDIVRDVCNVVPIQWIADLFGIPLKTPETPRGLITIPELRMALIASFLYVSFSILPKSGFMLEEAASGATEALWNIVSTRLKTASGIKDTALDWLSKGTAYEDSDQSEEFYKALVATKLPVEELTANCLGVMIGIAGNLTQQISKLVDVFLRQEYDADRKRVVELSRLNTPAADEELWGYIKEGIRLAPVVIGLPRLATRDIVVKDGDRTISLRAGDRIIVGISKAHMDPTAFPDPTKMNPRRPAESYMLLGEGLHYCFGARLVKLSMLSMLKSIYKLDGLRRAEGRGSHLVGLTDNLAGLESHFYLDSTCSECPNPVSLQLLYDASTPDEPCGPEAVKDVYFAKKKSTMKAKAPGVNGTSNGTMQRQSNGVKPPVNGAGGVYASPSSGTQQLYDEPSPAAGPQPNATGANTTTTRRTVMKRFSTLGRRKSTVPATEST